MRQLLDTHSFIWFVMGHPKITARARSQIENNDNLLSFASVWEVAIKSSLGKLNLGVTLDVLLEEYVIGNGISLLDIKTTHLSVVANLPLHHRDPFDRLLIAQAIVEKLPIVGRDEMFDLYEIQRIW